MKPARKKSKPVQFNVRLASELVENLKKAAKQKGVSLNAETVERLGKSFAEEAAFGGEAGRRLLHFIATAFVFAGERYYRDRINPEQKTRPGEALDISLWINEPEAHAAAMLSAIEALMLHQPGVTAEKCRLQLLSLDGRIATRFLNKEKVS